MCRICVSLYCHTRGHFTSRYGKGIYCSPDPRTALAYSLSKGGFEFQVTFDGITTSGWRVKFKGKKYLLVIQIRVDPEKLKVVKPSHGYGNGEYWLMPTGMSCAHPLNLALLPN